MSNITIQLNDDQLRQLQNLADEAKVRPEELLHECVVEWLHGPSQEFWKAARYVLKKNEELYRRLA